MGPPMQRCSDCGAEWFQVHLCPNKSAAGPSPAEASFKAGWAKGYQAAIEDYRQRFIDLETELAAIKVELDSVRSEGNELIAGDNDGEVDEETIGALIHASEDWML